MAVDLIQHELIDIGKHCESHIPGSKLITCVQAMVRVDIVRTKHKQLTVCIQFPKNYPNEKLLVELKSKYFSEKLLDGLTKVCDEECGKHLGKPQVLELLKFIENFIDKNPLCVCSEEIAAIKRRLISEKDELRLKQKTSSLILRVCQELYFLVVKIQVPDNYPLEQINVECKDGNFPELFKKHFTAQAVEVARQCVQPPMKRKPKDPPFEPKPSLWPVVRFLIDQIKHISLEDCQLCKTRCLPDDPKDIVTDDKDDRFAERIYCGHLFHNGCLNKYMKMPPFQGKTCPKCDQRIYHDKWKAAPQLVEARWAHEEAKKRELGEVVEFLQ